MATVALLQEVITSDPNFATLSTTLTATITVQAAGSILVVFVTNDTTSGASTINLRDNRNGAYTLVNDITSGFSQRLAMFRTNGSTQAGATLVTMTLSTAMLVKGLWIMEIGSGDPQSLETNAGQTDASSGTATDGLTSTAATPNYQPALAVGFTFWNGLTGSAPVAGTNYTLGSSNWAFGTLTTLASSEWQLLSSTAPVAATFTAGSDAAYIAYLLIIDQVRQFEFLDLI